MVRHEIGTPPSVMGSKACTVNRRSLLFGDGLFGHAWFRFQSSNLGGDRLSVAVNLRLGASTKLARVRPKQETAFLKKPPAARDTYLSFSILVRALNGSRYRPSAGVVYKPNDESWQCMDHSPGRTSQPTRLPQPH